MVGPPGNLLEARDSVFEGFEANDWLYRSESKVKFTCSNSANRPFDVVIPKLFMPVMEGFRGKECAWVK